MTVKIKHRRFGTSVTVDDKLGAALVKHGTHAYAVASEAPSVPAPSIQQSSTSTPPSSQSSAASNGTGTRVQAKRKGSAKKEGKRSYNRRDMQAKD